LVKIYNNQISFTFDYHQNVKQQLNIKVESIKYMGMSIFVEPGN